MKKSFYTLSVLLLLTLTFATPSARANDLPCQGADPYSGCPVNPGSGTALPINNGIIYLLIAGAVIGAIAVYKNKTVIAKAS